MHSIWTHHAILASTGVGRGGGEGAAACWGGVTVRTPHVCCVCSWTPRYDEKGVPHPKSWRLAIIDPFEYRLRVISMATEIHESHQYGDGNPRID